MFSKNVQNIYVKWLRTTYEYTSVDTYAGPLTKTISFLKSSCMLSSIPFTVYLNKRWRAFCERIIYIKYSSSIGKYVSEKIYHMSSETHGLRARPVMRYRCQ